MSSVHATEMADVLPTISVIVPVLNAASTLGRCVAALTRQDYPADRVEWIVVDNGSDDGSLEVLRSVSEVRCLQEPRPGAYAARNTGVSIASGDILAFTDPDCVVDAGWLRAVARAFEDPTVLVALGVRRPAPDVGLNRLLGDYEVAKDEWMLSCGNPRKYYGYNNTMAVRRSAWEQCGPFDDRLRGADTIFVRRVVDVAGCAAVRLEPGMRVSHLEMDGPTTYFMKAYIYGRSLQSYGRVVPVSPLTFRERLQVFGMAVRMNHLNLIRAGELLLLLVAGTAAWSAGRLAGLCGRR